jgi:CubicO group peptidase (beta-lactamase class C family)
MNMIRSRLFVPAAFMMLVVLTASSETRPEETDHGTEARLNAVFAPWDDDSSPGVAVAVIREGEIVFEKGYGIAQLEYGVAIGPSTVFHVASVSKQFTAMAVTLLAHEGKVSLDDDVHEYLPWLPEVGATVTVRHLLHHTSGVRELMTLLELGGWSEADMVSGDQVRSVLGRQRGLNFSPGSRFQYSNTGYVLLAEIVSAVSGQSFREFTRERIFDPLGMKQTHFHDDYREIVPNRAYSYLKQDSGGFRKAVLTFGYVGSTGLFTTAHDLVLWLDNFRQADVGGRAVIEQMHERAVLNDGSELDIAFGIGVGSYRGIDVVAHNGADAGYRSYVAWYEQPHVGIAVVSNLGSVDPAGLALEVADIVLADDFPEPKPAAAMPKAHEEASSDRSTPADPALLAEFVGKYQLATGPLLVISLEGGTLMARAGDERTAMHPMTKDTFLLPAFDAPITFRRRTDGEVSGLELGYGGERIEGTRLEDFEPTTPAVLEGYTGTYYSDEVGTVYTIDVVDGGLRVFHPRRGDSPATFVGVDTFASRLLPTMVFERNTEGEVAGVSVSGRNVAELRFRKIQYVPK